MGRSLLLPCRHFEIGRNQVDEEDKREGCKTRGFAGQARKIH